MTRAQEGTSASTKNTAGKTYKLYAGITAKTFNTDLHSGWQFVTYQTASAAPSITISSLNLSTDGAYHIIVNAGNNGTGFNLYGVVNNDSTAGGHSYAGNTASWSGSPASGGYANNAAFWDLSNYGERTHLCTMELQLGNWVSNSAPFMTFQTASFGSGGNATGAFRTAAGGGSYNGTNVTSMVFKTSSAGNADWKVWIYKRATS